MSQQNAITYNNVAGDNLAAKTLYDTRDLLQNAKNVSFFSVQATKVPTTDNYQSNPLGASFTVFGLGFDVNNVVIKTAVGIDPVKIANALRDAVVEFKGEGGTKQLFVLPLSQFLTVEQVSAIGTDVVVRLGTTGMQRLQQPFQIAQGVAFDLTILPVDTSGLPTAAQWGTAGYQPLRIRAMLQGFDSDEYARQEALAAVR